MKGLKKKGLMTYYRDIFKLIVTEQTFFVNSVISVVGIKEANTVLCVWFSSPPPPPDLASISDKWLQKWGESIKLREMAEPKNIMRVE